MNYVYGPIPSQRLGQSLGIDPIPFKTCNWNCVYCQLGRTTLVTRYGQRFWSGGGGRYADAAGVKPT
jgi:wyosine [tRNA(Phe)-imidazoG37] synthetase (radical SAM superfamily)